MKILIGILFVSIVSSESFKKCCPIDEVPNELFTCISNNSTQNSSEFASPKFIGYNVLVDYDSHWPSCGDQKLSFRPLTKNSDVSQSSSCIDLMNEKYFIFTCAENLNDDEKFLKVLKLNKCCPDGMSYDIFHRQCVENEGNFEEILKDKVALFEHNILKCNDSEVFVEYHSLVHGMKIYNNSLILTNTRPEGPDVIENSFCIETTFNSDIEIPSGMTEDHFHKRNHSKFIAKACRDISICENIPCLQKCCPHGERYFHNGTGSCLPFNFDVDLKFHDFNKDQSEKEPPAFEPTGKFLCAYLFLEARDCMKNK